MRDQKKTEITRRGLLRALVLLRFTHLNSPDFRIRDIVEAFKRVANEEHAELRRGWGDKTDEELTNYTRYLIVGKGKQQKELMTDMEGVEWFKASGHFTEPQKVKDPLYLLQGYRRTDAQKWILRFAESFRPRQEALRRELTRESLLAVCSVPATVMIAGAHWVLGDFEQWGNAVAIPVLPRLWIGVKSYEVDSVGMAEYYTPANVGYRRKELFALRRLITCLDNPDVLAETGCTTLLEEYTERFDEKDLYDTVMARLKIAKRMDIKLIVDVPVYRSLGTSGSVACGLAFFAESFAENRGRLPKQSGTPKWIRDMDTDKNMKLREFLSLGSQRDRSRRIRIFVLSHVLENLIHSDVGGLFLRGCPGLRGFSSCAGPLASLTGYPTMVTIVDKGVVDVDESWILTRSPRLDRSTIISLPTRPKPTAVTLSRFSRFLEAIPAESKKGLQQLSNRVADRFWKTVILGKEAHASDPIDFQQLITFLYHPVLNPELQAEVDTLTSGLGAGVSPCGDGQQGLYFVSGSSDEDIECLEERVEARQRMRGVSEEMPEILRPSHAGHPRPVQDFFLSAPLQYYSRDHIMVRGGGPSDIE